MNAYKFLILTAAGLAVTACGEATDMTVAEREDARVDVEATETMDASDYDGEIRDEVDLNPYDDDDSDRFNTYEAGDDLVDTETDEVPNITTDDILDADDDGVEFESDTAPENR